MGIGIAAPAESPPVRVALMANDDSVRSSEALELVMDGPFTC